MEIVKKQVLWLEVALVLTATVPERCWQASLKDLEFDNVHWPGILGQQIGSVHKKHQFCATLSVRWTEVGAG